MKYIDQKYLLVGLQRKDQHTYNALTNINNSLVTASNDITALQNQPVVTPFIPVIHQAAATYSLTTAAFNFVTYNAPVAGLYMLYGTFQIFLTVGDSAQTITCNLVGGGSGILLGTVNQTVTAGTQITLSLTAPYQAAVNALLALQIYKAGGTGTTTVQGTLNTVQIA